jgi:hypothetical protein
MISNGESLEGACGHLVLAVAAAIAFDSSAWAQGHVSDIGLRVSTTGQITTHLITTGGISPEQRVFAATFGDTGISGFTANPGFDALPATFAVGYRIGFNIRSALSVWNGGQFEATDPAGPLVGERLKLSFLTANVTSGAGSVPGFSLAVQSDGGWHRHLSFYLLAGTGTPAPDSGVYLLELELWSTDPAVQQSAPFWLVMNHVSSAEQQAAATAWVIDNLLPSPCPADIQGDGVVDGTDLAFVLGAWGGSGAADVNGSGVVDGSDLTIVLGAWGACQ